MPQDPAPARPDLALPSDVKNYALWLERQVSALDKAVQAYVLNPQAPASQREAVDFVVTVGHGVSWNKWLLGWRFFLAQNFEMMPSFIPIPIEIPVFDWDSVQRYQIEMEGYRSQFKSLGVPVPDETTLPPKGPPSLPALENIAIAAGVVAVVGLVGYLTYKFA